MIPHKAYFNWSGGKDSALSLYHVLKDKNFDVRLLLTSVNTTFQRVSMHGVRNELLHRQAESLGIPLQKIELREQPTMDEYNGILQQIVTELKEQAYTHAVFGDIFLEDLRMYREKQLLTAGISAHFPLWKRDTKELLTEFIDLGFKTILVCVKSELLDVSFAGRVIDREFVKDLPAHVDPCGENGEFHTFVYDGPIFKNPIKFEIGEKVYRSYQSPKSDDGAFAGDSKPEIGFWFCDLVPVQ